MKNSHKFYCNKDCKFYPCHEMEGDMNCMFCFCPLYMLGKDCGGNFTYTEKGVKDCSKCTIPHSEGGYDYIMEKMKLVIERTKIKTEEQI